MHRTAICKGNAAHSAGAIKQHALLTAGFVPAPAKAPATGKRVAIIGGGPSGLSAAYYLALMGRRR